VITLTSQLSELDPNQASLTAQENARLRLELNEMAKQNEFLTTAAKSQQETISHHESEVARAQADASEALLASETAKADLEFALTNAQNAIAALETELEELQESIKEEQAEAEMQRLLVVQANGNTHQLPSNPNVAETGHFTISQAGQPPAGDSSSASGPNHKNAQHFNIHDDA